MLAKSAVYHNLWNTLVNPAHWPLFLWFHFFFRGPPADHWALVSGLPSYVAENGFVSFHMCSKATHQNHLSCGDNNIRTEKRTPANWREISSSSIFFPINADLQHDERGCRRLLHFPGQEICFTLNNIHGTVYCDMLYNFTSSLCLLIMDDTFLMQYLDLLSHCFVGLKY